MTNRRSTGTYHSFRGSGSRKLLPQILMAVLLAANAHAQTEYAVLNLGDGTVNSFRDTLTVSATNDTVGEPDTVTFNDAMGNGTNGGTITLLLGDVTYTTLERIEIDTLNGAGITFTGGFDMLRSLTATPVLIGGDETLTLQNTQIDTAGLITFAESVTVDLFNNGSPGHDHFGPNDPSVSVQQTATLGLTNDQETISTLTTAAGAVVALNGTSQLTLNGNGDSSVQGLVSGTGTVLKGGTGVLNLAFANTVSGGITLNDGTVAVGLSNAALGTGTLTVADTGDDGTLLFNTDALNLANAVSLQRSFIVNTGTNTATLSGVISESGGARSLTKIGSGVLILDGGADTYSGGTNINAGTLRLASAQLFDSGQVTASNGATFDVNNQTEVIGSLIGETGSTIALGATGALTTNGDNSSTAIAGTITGAAGSSLTKMGTGTLTFTGANAGFGGTVNLSNGVIAVGTNNNALGTGALVVNDTGDDALLVFNTNGMSLGNNVTLTENVTVATGAFNETLAGVVSGAGNLAKTGTGSLTLSGANTHTGGTTLAGGTLVVNNATALGGAAGVVSFNGTGTEVLQFNVAATPANALQLASNATVNTNGNNVTLSGAISQIGGARTFTKTGTGVLTLSGAANYSGATNINAGTLALGANNVLNDATTVVVASGATLDVAGNTDTIGSLSGVAGSALTLAAGSLTTNGNDTSTTFAGTITSAAGGRLIKDGTGTLTLSGSNGTGFDGGVRLDNGTVVMNTSTAIGESAFTFNDTGDDGVLRIGSSDIIVSNAIVLTRSGTVDTAGVSTTFTGGISGAAASSFSKTGAGDLNLSTTASTFTGGTNVNVGTLRMQNANLLAATGGVTVFNGAIFDANGFNQTIGNLSGEAGSSVTLAGGVLTVGDTRSTTFSGTISGTAGLIKTGTGVLTLEGANTGLSNNVTLSGGTLRVANVDALGTGAVEVTVAGATLGLGTVNSTITSNISLAANGTVDTSLQTNALSGVISESVAGRSLTVNGGGTLNLAGTNTYTGGTIVNAGTTVGITALNNLGTGGITLNDATLAIGAGMTFDRAIALTGTSTVDTVGTSVTVSSVITGTTLRKAGSGLLTLSGANTHANTTLADGTLILANDTGLGTAGFTFAGSGDEILRMAGNRTVANNIAVTANGTIDTSGFNAVFSGLFTGTQTVTRTGAGTLNLTGASAGFAGNFVANGGVTQLTGSLGAAGAGDLTVNSGATLIGGGAIGDDLINRGTVSPGTSAGTLTVGGDYNQEATGTYVAEVFSDGTKDLIDATGDANLAGSLSVLGEVSKEIEYFGQSFTVLEADGTINGNWTTLTDNLPFIGASVTIDNSGATSLARVTFNTLGTNFNTLAAFGNANQTNVANVLQDLLISGQADIDLRSVITQLLRLPPGQAANALQQIAGEVHAATIEATLQSNNLFTSRVSAQLSNQRMGAGAFGGSGVDEGGDEGDADSDEGSDEESEEEDSEDEESEDEEEDEEEDAAPVSLRLGMGNTMTGFGIDGLVRSGVYGAPSATPWLESEDQQIWILGTGLWGHVDPTGVTQGFEYSGAGFIIGSTWRADANFLWGIQAGFTANTIEAEAAFDKTDVESTNVGVHGSWFEDNDYVDGVVGVVRNDYDNSRFMQFGTINRIANGNYDGDEVYAYIETGRICELGEDDDDTDGSSDDDDDGPFHLQPQAAFQFRNYEQDGYTETGAGALNRTVEANQLQSYQTAIGGRLFWENRSASGRLMIPEVQVRWAHEFGDIDRTVQSSFVGTNRTLVINGRKGDRDTVQVKTGMTIHTSDATSVDVMYNGDFGDGQANHAAAARAIWRF